MKIKLYDGYEAEIPDTIVQSTNDFNLAGAWPNALLVFLKEIEDSTLSLSGAILTESDDSRCYNINYDYIRERILEWLEFELLVNILLNKCINLGDDSRNQLKSEIDDISNQRRKNKKVFEHESKILSYFGINIPKTHHGKWEPKLIKRMESHFHNKRFWHDIGFSTNFQIMINQLYVNVISVKSPRTLNDNDMVSPQNDTSQFNVNLFYDKLRNILSPDNFELVYLRLDERMSFNDIAICLGIKAITARQRYHRLSDIIKRLAKEHFLS